MNKKQLGIDAVGALFLTILAGAAVGFGKGPALIVNNPDHLLPDNSYKFWDIIQGLVPHEEMSHYFLSETTAIWAGIGAGAGLALAVLVMSILAYQGRYKEGTSYTHKMYEKSGGGQ